ncbi:uncharacterized protein TrAtP1_009916 [Trichoderma atroviride]|uniref:uncharacterized protein n=1 Tax=Hypocrea atroviridis TaxID=63577 RepID=UPI003328D289|nr:hypothetical protein TrAtP1_009916 [Trichoderma atroviride]
MVRESALFQADGGAGWGETNEHATTGRIAEQMASRDGGAASESGDGKGRSEMQRAQGSSIVESVSCGGDWGLAVVSAALELLAERAHAVASC